MLEQRKAMGDATSAKLAKMGSAIGNDEIQKRLAQGNATRDELLQFLSQRLTTIRDVQLREIEQCQVKILANGG